MKQLRQGAFRLTRLGPSIEMHQHHFGPGHDGFTTPIDGDRLRPSQGIFNAFRQHVQSVEQGCRSRFELIRHRPQFVPCLVHPQGHSGFRLPEDVTEFAENRFRRIMIRDILGGTAGRPHEFEQEFSFAFRADMFQEPRRKRLFRRFAGIAMFRGKQSMQATRTEKPMFTRPGQCRFETIDQELTNLLIRLAGRFRRRVVDGRIGPFGDGVHVIPLFSRETDVT